jgi:hypothetical protein
VRNTRWAACLGSGEVGACQEVAGGFAWAVELDPGVVVRWVLSSGVRTICSPGVTARGRVADAG